MLRMLVVCLVLGGTAHAQPSLVNVTAASRIAQAHTRTLREALVRGDVTGTLDVSIVKLSVTPRGHGIEVRAEVRGALTDASGRMRAAATTRVLVRGDARERAQLERDALVEAGRQLTITLARSPR